MAQLYFKYGAMGSSKTATAPVRVGHRTDTAVPYLKAADFPYVLI